MKTSIIICDGANKCSEENVVHSWCSKYAEELIKKEETERKEADALLQQNIDSEISNRESADAQLKEEIESEKEQRQTADNLLYSLASKARIYDYSTNADLNYPGRQLLNLPIGAEFIMFNNRYDAQYPDDDTTYGRLYVSGEFYYELSASIEPHKAYKCKIISQAETGVDGYNGEIEVIGEFADSDAYDEFIEHRENTTLDHPDKSVKQQHIADKAVGTGQIADYAVGQTQLQQYAVSSAKIYPGAVKTTHLADNNVTKVKLSSDVQQELDKVTEVQEVLTQEISDRQEADNLLDEKISAMQSIEGYRNRCFDISEYQNEEGLLITDDNGNKYLAFMVSFDSGTYKSMHMTIDKFVKAIAYPSKVSIKFNVYSRHLAAEGCDTGGLISSESGIVVYFSDGTWTRYGVENCKYANGGTKEIIQSGKSNTYYYGEYEYSFDTEKAIDKIVYDMTADNFYSGDNHGVCKEEVLISYVECLDDTSVATVGDIRRLEESISKLNV